MDVIRAALGQDAATAARIVAAGALRDLQRAFADRRAWYGKEEIDELSDEESRVIASRLVQRMLSIIDLDAQRQELVRRVIAHACARVLTTSEPGTPATRAKLLGDAILDAARRELNSQEFAPLARALASGGHRPAPGEV